MAPCFLRFLHGLELLELEDLIDSLNGEEGLCVLEQCVTSSLPLLRLQVLEDCDVSPGSEIVPFAQVPRVLPSLDLQRDAADVLRYSQSLLPRIRGLLCLCLLILDEVVQHGLVRVDARDDLLSGRTSLFENTDPPLELVPHHRVVHHLFDLSLDYGEVSNADILLVAERVLRFSSLVDVRASLLPGPSPLELDRSVAFACVGTRSEVCGHADADSRLGIEGEVVLTGFERFRVRNYYLMWLLM